MRIEVEATSMKLGFDPVCGRRTFYAKFTFGHRTWWLMRWDTARVEPKAPFAFSRDRLMCWSAGVRSANPRSLPRNEARL